MTKRTLVWFRRDLRLHDHLALAKALEQGPVAAIFTVSDDMRKREASCWWLHHSLFSLQKALHEQGVTLLLSDENPTSVLPKLVKTYLINQVVWNDSYTTDERKEEVALKKVLEEAGISYEACYGDVLFPQHELTKDNGDPYSIFTPFYKRSQKETVKRPVALQEDWQSIQVDALKSLDELKLLPERDWYKKFEAYWTPGEQAGIEQFKQFADDDIADYKKMRDFPDADGTSRISPYLTWGNLSVRAVYYAASRREHAEPYLRQLVWREFARRQLMQHPTLETKPLRTEFNEFPWRDSQSDFDKWKRGETGYPLVDAGMKQLWETGWMHNRVRMVAASFLTKHLLLPWQWGADWFKETLVDYDEANNAMGWQWVAGTGIDSAPYFRIFNPETQLEKFDSNGEYVHEFTKDQDVAPIVDHKEARARALAAYERIKK
ncbi:cryptochrome/photolyase family protein [Chryseomicrobium palamuruense]|uniref:Cryptochrome/photolyase family protein n=1 Tax=Chryseomicrobium palamuruense TaxID=682973 RepID=A0ABV8UWY0_9BACL